ncbi:MAG: mitochondrial peripheral inner membrane protein [Trizodia sp. TS-e1964]|nr:MAG: mitochondrial peripheral inner membrane protein [Trizodia sp. TS-e1964]
MAASPAATLTSTIQSLSLNRAPSPTHDLAPRSSLTTSHPSAAHASPRPPRPRAHLPPLPDLRFEQSYLRSIAGVCGWRSVLYVTVRDQVVFPLVQGLVWTLLLQGWRAWMHGARWSGRGVGGTIASICYGIYNSPGAADSSEPIHPTEFSTFILARKEYVSSTSNIYTLKPKEAASTSAIRDNFYAGLWRTGVWSVQFRQPQLQIARSYTPLPPPAPEISKSDASLDLRFLIRKEPDGEISDRYLDRLPIGSEIDIRGPHIEFEIPQDVSDVVFLAGGTGIAPAIQAANCALHSRASKPLKSYPKVHILWASRKREDCVGGGEPPHRAASYLWRLFTSSPRPKISAGGESQGVLVKEVEALKRIFIGSLDVDYFVDEEGSSITPDIVCKALSPKCIDSEPKKPGSKLILVSGPDGFIRYIAGPKEWKAGSMEQGKIGGLLAGLDIRGWDVWKL